MKKAREGTRKQNHFLIEYGTTNPVFKNSRVSKKVFSKTLKFGGNKLRFYDQKKQRKTALFALKRMRETDCYVFILSFIKTLLTFKNLAYLGF